MTLRPLRPGDEEAAVGWAANDEFCLAIDWELHLPPERVRRHWQGIIAGEDPEFLRLGIEYAGRLVGYVDLGGSDGISAEFGVAIGEPALWSRGVGTAAGLALLRYAFGMVGLQTVRAEVHQPNTRSQALMRRLGFTQVGVCGEEAYQGEVVPVIRYEINRDQLSPTDAKY